MAAGKRDINVLHVVKEFSPPSQTFIYDLIVGLEQVAGIHNSVVCYKRRTMEAQRPWKAVCSIQTLRKKYLTPSERLVDKFFKDQTATLVKRLLLDRKPDLIHCHFAWATWDFICPGYFELNESIPIIVSTHGTDVLRSAQRKPNNDVLQSLSNRPNAYFTATSDFMADQLIRLGLPRQKVVIVPNSVNPAFFGARKRQREGDFRIINNARMTPWKGQSFLIGAFARFVKEVSPNAMLTLIGDGEQLEQIQQSVCDLGVNDKVKFMGVVPHQDIPEILRDQDLYIQPSIIDDQTGQLEAFGVAVLEAIAVGLPVIVTNTGGLPYVVGGDSTFAKVVPQKSSEALYQAMLEIYEKGVHKKDNIEYAREKNQQFSSEAQLSACLDAYDKCLSVSS